MERQHKITMPAYRRILVTVVAGVLLLASAGMGTFSHLDHGPLWLDLEAFCCFCLSLFGLRRTWS